MRRDEVEWRVAGQPVHGYRTGTGPSVVLLHGGGLDSAHLSWAPVWSRLQGRADLLAPDLPGYGDTPLGDTLPTLAGYRRWLEGLLDAAGVDRAVLAGVSLGGGIAVRTALDAPARVAGLVLAAPYGLGRHTPGGILGYLAVHAPGLPALTRRLLRSHDGLLRSSLRAVLRRSGTVTDDLVAEVRSLLAAAQFGVAWSDFQRYEVRPGGLRTHFGPELAQINMPAVLLAGGLDRLVRPTDVGRAAAGMRHGQFTLVPGAGHWLNRDAPDEVAAAILQVLG